MSRCLRMLRSVAAVLVVLGTAGPAWATYCGGACYRSCPAPVVETQCNVVALAPQCQTLMQTAYETVYENQAYTVMQTRYRTEYRAENYTVMRPVRAGRMSSMSCTAKAPGQSSVPHTNSGRMRPALSAWLACGR